ncbi:MAG: hypothetical protein KDA52_23685 [Planctomycetaceae bacterium]|nr:hypothetical protein [Planctomycetaceae bacterium]
MNIDIRDADAIRTLRPLEVATYLRSTGWTQQSTSLNASTWIRNVDKAEYEAVVPLDQAMRDYSLRMGDLLHTVAAAEGRSQTEVYADFLTTFADVVRIRIDDPGLKDGTLPIEANAQIAQKSRDLLLAAACSATEFRPVWHTRKPVQAVEQVRRIRIGQSERGSYIVTVISRVSPALHVPENGQLFEPEPPFGRRVIQTLASSLDTLNKAADSAALTGEFESFEQSVSKGVSANLCDAVAGLWGEDESQRKLEFTFSWSPARPIDSSTPSHVKFAADRIPLIREASRVMREHEPVGDFELEGAVVKLDRQPDQSTGIVTIIGQVDGRPRRVKLELGDPQYHIAVQAHDQERAIRCVGSLVREGRGFSLTEPREIAVEDE